MIQIEYEKLKIQRFDFCQVGRYFWGKAVAQNFMIMTDVKIR